MQKLYAVATNIDKVKKDSDLSMLDWLPMKSKSCFTFVNMMQVHFTDKEKAIEFYNSIKQKNIIVFKNWE